MSGLACRGVTGTAGEMGNRANMRVVEGGALRGPKHAGCRGAFCRCPRHAGFGCSVMFCNVPCSRTGLEQITMRVRMPRLADCSVFPDIADPAGLPSLSQTRENAAVRVASICSIFFTGCYILIFDNKNIKKRLKRPRHADFGCSINTEQYGTGFVKCLILNRE